METFMKRTRAPNWDNTEKALLKEILKEDINIIENKCTDTNTNKSKIKAWQKVHSRFTQVNDRGRTLQELKQQWRGMKMETKKTISTHRQAVLRTGGGPKPPSPSPETIDMLQLIPLEFQEDSNKFDSDGPPVIITSDEILQAEEVGSDSFSAGVVSHNGAEPALCEVEDDLCGTYLAPSRSTPNSKWKRKRQPFKDDSYKYSIQKVAEDRSANILQMRRKEHEWLQEEHEKKMKNLREETKINKLRLEILMLEKEAVQIKMQWTVDDN